MTDEIGDIYTVENEGMPVYKRPGEKGTLYVKFEVEFPKDLSAEKKKALASVLPPPHHHDLTDGKEVKAKMFINESDHRYFLFLALLHEEFFEVTNPH